MDLLRFEVQQEVLRLARFRDFHLQSTASAPADPEAFTAPVNAENGLFLPAINVAVRTQLYPVDGGYADESRTLQPVAGP